jgi:hypothetical protein
METGRTAYMNGISELLGTEWIRKPFSGVLR